MLNIDVSLYPTGLYLLYSSGGSVCLLGYVNNLWQVTFTSLTETKIKDNILTINGNSWYAKYTEGKFYKRFYYFIK